jgi:hypothetical protein
MTPDEAKKPSSEVDAKLAMELVARRGWRSPVFQVGDIVRILRKKKTGEKEKEEKTRYYKADLEDYYWDYCKYKYKMPLQ